MTQSACSETLTTFLSSSLFAEEDGAPLVERLLKHPWQPEERRLLESYAAEEAVHVELLETFFRKRGLKRGPPFWIQPLFHLARARTTLLVQVFHLEVMAALFYGAVAARTEDPEARELIRRLLRDEARHIRLFRELLARDLAGQTLVGRGKAWLLSWAIRHGARVTAEYQVRQLAPLLGRQSRALPSKLLRQFTAELDELFRAPDAQPKSLSWWWGATGPELPARLG